MHGVQRMQEGPDQILCQKDDMAGLYAKLNEADVICWISDLLWGDFRTE